MSGINKVILVGHLGKDPEVRYLEGGVSVASFPLATTETFNKDGRKVEQTEWHNIVLWRSLADVAAKFLQKGKLVLIRKFKTVNHLLYYLQIPFYPPAVYHSGALLLLQNRFFCPAW